MIDYDFSTLNDKEFENLSIDLISKDKDRDLNDLKLEKMVELMEDFIMIMVLKK